MTLPLSAILVLFAFLIGSDTSAGAEPTNPFGTDAEPKLIAEGFERADTPTWSTKAGGLYLSDLETNTLHRIDPDAETDPVTDLPVRTERIKAGPDGKLYGVVDGAIVRLGIVPGGSGVAALSVFAPQGQKLSLNDMAFSKDSRRLYFTTLKDPEFGRVSRVDLTTGKAAILFDGQLTPTLRNPNGIAISPDDKFLYVGISSYAARNNSGVYRFPLGPGGLIAVDPSELQPWATIKAPDGITIASNGTVFVTAGRTIHAVSSSGERLGAIKLPNGSATNFCLSPDEGTLYVTTREKLYAISLAVPESMSE